MKSVQLAFFLQTKFHLWFIHYSAVAIVNHLNVKMAILTKAYSYLFALYSYHTA